MPANLIFYDTETSGIQKDFSQILQCGSIQTNRRFEELAQQNIGCRPLPWVNPQPKAMLTNKKIELFNYGKHIRDITFIDDICMGIEKLILKNNKFI